MYDDAFYQTVRDGARRSANAVVDTILMRALIPRPKSVIDVGCGEGWWAAAFGRHGCMTLAVDNHPKPPAGSPLAESSWAQHNLNEPLPADLGHHDLAVCLEVGEHLPASCADQLVDGLSGVSDQILWSAAIPGQGGHGHINEAWPSYWLRKFEAHGFSVSGAIRWIIWDHPEVENWYRQNLFFLTRFPDRFPELFADAACPYPIPVVHPVLWSARTGVPAT